MCVRWAVLGAWGDGEWALQAGVDCDADSCLAVP